MAQEVCQQAVDSAQQKDGGNAANLAAESEYESGKTVVAPFHRYLGEDVFRS